MPGILDKNTYHKLPILDGLELLDAKKHTSSFPFHTHNTFNVTLVINQPFSTKINDRFLQAPHGTITITNPQEVHATICDKTAGNSFFTFYIPPSIFTKANNRKEVFFDNNVIYDKTLFREMYTLSGMFSEAGIEKRLQRVVENLVAGYGKPDHFPDHKTKLFQDFLEEELSEKFSLEKTAQRFGLDKYKFLRLFKQQTGLTPNNFIILKRIEKSKKLLLIHDNLLDIAIESGFYDATHFCKHFKKITGITPLAYKNA